MLSICTKKLLAETAQINTHGYKGLFILATTGYRCFSASTEAPGPSGWMTRRFQRPPPAGISHKQCPLLAHNDCNNSVPFV